MNVRERNALLDECIKEYKQVHDRFFPRKGPLTDEDWKECFDRMNMIADKYKPEIPNFSEKICMAFMDDLEEFHKKWKSYSEQNSN